MFVGWKQWRRDRTHSNILEWNKFPLNSWNHKNIKSYPAIAGRFERQKLKFLVRQRFVKHSVQFSPSVMSDSLWPHGLQHARPPCPSPTPRVCSNSCPLSWWWHPAISSSVLPFSFCLQPFPASGSFPISQVFISGGQSIGVSASTSVLPMNTQDQSPLWWTGWISL